MRGRGESLPERIVTRESSTPRTASTIRKTSLRLIAAPSRRRGSVNASDSASRTARLTTSPSNASRSTRTVTSHSSAIGT
jgi:hypothetical protein